MSRQLRIRSLLDSKISKEMPLSRHSILHQVHQKIRTYLKSNPGADALPSPKSTRRPIRSPLRRTSQVVEAVILSYQQPKQIVNSQTQLKNFIFDSIEERNELRLLQICLRLVSLAIQHDWPIVMASTLILFGWIFQELRDWQLSIYLLAKCTRFTTVMRNDLLKGEAFYGIGKNLRIMGRYDESMKCYKKALQYLWRASKRHPFAETLEIELYQQMSFCLLHVNQIEQSDYFRKRFQRGTTEASISSIHKLSNDFLRNFERNKIEINQLSPNISVLIGVDFIEIDRKINPANYKSTSPSSHDDYTKKYDKPLKTLFEVNFHIMLDNFFADSEFRDQIPLPFQGSNEKLFADIEAYIEKRNKKKFVEPARQKTTVGLDMFERRSRARQGMLRKGMNVFSTDKLSGFGKSYSTLGQTTVLKTTVSKVVSMKNITWHFQNFIRRVNSKADE